MTVPSEVPGTTQSVDGLEVGQLTGFRSSDEIPIPPEAILIAARNAPDHWFYLADPSWRGANPAPSWALLGRWRSDAAGEIVEWEDNESYRPSPEALGWPEPADALDTALQRAATGYGPVEEVPRLLAQTELVVLLGPEGEPAVTTAPDDSPAVAVFTTSPDLDGAELPDHETMSASDLLSRLPTDAYQLLCLSPTAPVSMTVAVSDLREALGEEDA
ncbi:type VII secretion system-associated protein [Streptomyces galbus]|uniref:type VII secretion system-associated protein n=1 Tax=Streptomyces galbus TaxID=33898 RepID=UPI00380AB10B